MTIHFCTPACLQHGHTVTPWSVRFISPAEFWPVLEDDNGYVGKHRRVDEDDE